MLKNKFIKSKFLNKIIVKGQKQSSENELLKCFKSLQKSQRSKSSLEIFTSSITNSSPFFQLKKIKSKRRKNEIEIPFFLNEDLRLFYGIKNLIKNTNFMKQMSFYRRLNIELLKGADLKGQSLKNTSKLHKDVFVKKKYARYRWF